MRVLLYFFEKSDSLSLSTIQRIPVIIDCFINFILLILYNKGTATTTVVVNICNNQIPKTCRQWHQDLAQNKGIMTIYSS